MSFVEVDGVQLFYTDEGEGGPTLLFVHGYACDSHDWSWQIPHFVGDHRVIAMDLRGHGRSGVPDQGYESLRFAADLAGLVEQLACEPVVAIGHSLGALVVSALAVVRPDLVRAVVAIDPAYLIPMDVHARVAPGLEALTYGDPVPVAQAMLDHAESPGMPGFLRCWHRRRVAGVPPLVLRETLLNMSGGPEAPESDPAGHRFLQRRACPVLSFYTASSRAVAEEALFSDHRSSSVAWERSGHWLHQERPEDFNLLVDAWLASL